MYTIPTMGRNLIKIDSIFWRFSPNFDAVFVTSANRAELPLPLPPYPYFPFQTLPLNYNADKGKAPLAVGWLDVTLNRNQAIVVLGRNIYLSCSYRLDIDTMICARYLKHAQGRKTNFLIETIDGSINGTTGNNTTINHLQIYNLHLVYIMIDYVEKFCVLICVSFRVMHITKITK
jgi:hypothetical protein